VLFEIDFDSAEENATWPRSNGMTTFIDRVADARDIAELFDLVNEFIGDLQRMPEVQQIPTALMPGWINTADDLSYWLHLLSEEIRQRDASDKEIPDIMFALHAVLETALQRPRSDWYHITELRASWDALAPASVPGKRTAWRAFVVDRDRLPKGSDPEPMSGVTVR
jgi:hypothetical protein